jgi:hypothetical protein
MSFLPEDEFILVDENGNKVGVNTLSLDTQDPDGQYSLNTTSTLFGRISGTEIRPVRIDSSTNSIQIVTYEHHEIHSGSHYFIDDTADLSADDVFDMQWTTPDTAESAHFQFILACEKEYEWYIYEGAVIITAGATITPINNNRNSLNTSNADIKSILNTSLVNANADTDVSGALQIAHGVVGAGKTGGQADRNAEIILKRNEIYCMRAIAIENAYVNFTVKWYEHTPKN